ncbi:MAG: ABC1 kinase family protein [Microthrixaceae bacterium]
MLARRGAHHLRALLRDRAAGVRPPAPRGAAELRRTLTDLGPAYVKLGQLLSTRGDLLPPGYREELTLLQAQVPPVPYSEVAATIRAELGRPPEEAFAEFDRAPLAAASIGQVHAATLEDGTDAVVKVRRSDVARLVEADLHLLHRVAWLVAALGERTRDRYDPEGLADEFAAALRRECDYRVEAAVAAELREHFRTAGLPVHVPAVHPELSSAGVLTMDRVGGVRLDDVDGLRAAGLDPAAVAETFADAFMSMVFGFGVFHADPHPGNVFVRPDGSIALVDFGKHGRVDGHLKQGLAMVLAALVGGDLDGLVRALESLEMADSGVDRDALRADLAVLVERYGNRPLGEIQVGTVFGEVMTVVRRHHLRLPPDLMLLLATVVMCEGVAVDLDPDFELQPVLLRWAAGGGAPG